MICMFYMLLTERERDRERDREIDREEVPDHTHTHTPLFLDTRSRIHTKSISRFENSWILRVDLADLIRKI
mgnify:CR=1 FL=1